MSVLEKQTGLDELKTRLRNTWMTGDWMRRGATVADCGESGGACDRV
jgi:hypothetical protein